ncbi:AMP-binding protein [Mycobacterium nebraskense]|uniref:AMP-dependent synthetase n=1 Tax=Mycobacterium nebraskense TaxID=244292 RepID=A0A0F5NBL6_9MYCO|nr:AMP-binding protein [Mycobacterium nebraskense]KKC04454.1 AMP-dependent synthetase [Mycobacterium nebraskense]KLO40356.1 AMP-dependent synthetase [Mycobacterium nebraskense]MBI2696382.1 AMP-binding protein [Mycobacterium nebraskense]MCV7115844.1 AMP-binding protein [Mycobacterium nebraskense]ORW28327.1 AMP-dependent synthetase [Mycobacterium nebraskense]
MSEPIPPIGTQIAALAELAPDEPAVTCDGLTLTRAELDASTNRLARAYADRGVGVGDYVTMVLPNSVEWIQAAVACWKLGAVPQPLSARLPDAELQGLLDLRPPALLVGREHPGIPSVPAGFTPGPDCSDTALPEAVSPVWKAMGSGGSTGRPKLIESGGDSRIPAAIGYPLGAQEGDTTLIPIPLSHNTGFTTATLALLMRHHLVVMSRFDPERFLRLITDHRVTFLTTVPTIMQRALPVYHADPGSYDLSSIRRFWHMGAPCPPAIKQAWIELLDPEKVWELYGGTELQALTFISGDQWLTHRGSVGVVVAGEMKVLDDDGNPCPPGVVGEIYMRPGADSAPTYRYVGATAKSRDGWDSLGDLGHFDADGFLYLSDRRVDMFTVGGRNVYPAEIENALSAHPDVLSCLVVGVPDPNSGDLGQVPYALVHTADGATLDAAGVQEFLRGHLAAYKVPPTPNFIEFVDAPLRDDAGKARRSAVRAEIIARLQAAEPA